jgi:archaellum component FlaC
MADIVKRLVVSNETLSRANNMVHQQLADALDGIEDLRNQIRTKDEMIGELQAIVGAGARFEKSKGTKPEDR